MRGPPVVRQMLLQVDIGLDLQGQLFDHLSIIDPTLPDSAFSPAILGRVHPLPKELAASTY
jgi:hypothetical protein